MKPWPKAWPTNGIICCRVGDPYWNPVPGSKMSQCWQCNHAVMMSPTSIAKGRETPDAIVVCLNCFRAWYDETGQKVRVPLDTPEQVKELGKKRTWEGTIFADESG